MNSKKPQKTKTDAKAAEQLKFDLRQEDDFAVKYANHVAVVQTGFDVKVTFGRIDPGLGANVILQNTAIVLPWPAVKTLVYLLQASLVGQEEFNGHIPYPAGGIIPPARSLPAEFAAQAKAKRVHEKVLKAWDDFLAANPEALPEE